MQIGSNSAIIDNDFLNHVVEMRKNDDEMVLIVSNVFGELEIEPAIHPLVFEKEVLKSNGRIKRLFDESVIKKLTFEDIHNNDQNKKSYYSFLVLELYKKLTGETLNTNEQTVFDFWRTMHSLGEIHSLATCLLCGCGVFLSDDKDSQILKRIIEETFLTTILVHNRQAVVALLREKGTSMSRKNLQSFSHV